MIFYRQTFLWYYMKIQFLCFFWVFFFYIMFLHFFIIFDFFQFLFCIFFNFFSNGSMFYRFFVFFCCIFFNIFNFFDFLLFFFIKSPFIFGKMSTKGWFLISINKQKNTFPWFFFFLNDSRRVEGLWVRCKNSCQISFKSSTVFWTITLS